ncbi:MAG: glycosyl hydrolase family 28-related protein [Balneolales bacterium]
MTIINIATDFGTKINTADGRIKNFMKMNRKEAIKRSAILMGGYAFIPATLGALQGCTPATSGIDKNLLPEDLVIINNVSDLRTKKGKPGESAILSGYYKANDGGGTEVYWDNESTEDDDNGMIFKVDGITSGRWKRSDDGHINVKWFGARGDGVLRTETVDQINDCINWVSNNIYYGTLGTTPRKVYIPEGTYILEKALLQLENHKHNGIEIFGDGPELTELKFRDDQSGNSGNELRMLRWKTEQITGIKDVHIHDIKFNGNWRNTAGEGEGGLFILYKRSFQETSQNVLVENCYFTGSGGNGCAIRSDNTTIKNCKSWDNKGHGFSTGNTPDGVNILDCEAWECAKEKDGTGRGFYGLDFSNGSNLYAENIDIWDCGNGFKTSARIAGPTHLKNVTIKNSVDVSIRQTGAEEDAVPGNSLKLENVHTENSSGSWGWRFTDVDLEIINCTLTDEPGDDDWYGAIYFTDRVRDLTIDGLDITRNSGTGSYAIRNDATGTVSISRVTTSGYDKTFS